MSDTSYLFSTLKARYTELDTLSTLDNTLLSSSSVTLLLDSKEVFKQFRNSYFAEISNKIIKEKQSFELATEFFNLVGHYRNYFEKKGLPCRIILFHSNKDSLRDSLFPNRNDYLVKHVPLHMKFLDFVVEKRIRTIANLLEEVYVVTSEDLDVKLDRCILPLLFNSQETNIFDEEGSINILCSSEYDFLNLVNYIPNSYQLYMNNKKPSFFHGSKVFNYITKGYKSKFDYVPSTYLPMYSAVNGFSAFEEPTTLTKKATILRRLGTTYTQLSKESLDESFLMKLFSIERLEDVTELIKRLEYFEFNQSILSSNISDIDVQKVLAQYMSFTDYDMLENINAKYCDSKLNTKFL